MYGRFHAIDLFSDPFCSCEAIKSGRISKPMIAWCIGTCGSMFSSEVQFGHAGACANSNLETAVEKNKALKAAGAIVPERCVYDA